MPDETKILIYVVDDDASVRKSLTMLFMSADMEVKTFEAAEDFLKGQFREKKACLISDIKLKGLNGLVTFKSVRMVIIQSIGFEY